MKSTCCDEAVETIEWKSADNFNGPDADSWCICIPSGGGICWITVSFCPFCGTILPPKEPG